MRTQSKRRFEVKFGSQTEFAILPGENSIEFEVLFTGWPESGQPMAQPKRIVFVLLQNAFGGKCVINAFSFYGSLPQNSIRTTPPTMKNWL